MLIYLVMKPVIKNTELSTAALNKGFTHLIMILLTFWFVEKVYK